MERPGRRAPDGIGARQRWMALLARAPLDALEKAVAGLDGGPGHDLVRGPEVGLVMVRGRAGGTGARFNLGEMTVTRCTVRSRTGRLGHAYIQGRSPRRAELAAALDAALQEPAAHDLLDRTLLAPLAAALEERRVAAAATAATTRVEFFSMVRGEE